MNNKAIAKQRAVARFDLNTQAALKALYAYLRGGMEFPDACWKAARNAGLSVDELRNTYDEVESA